MDSAEIIKLVRKNIKGDTAQVVCDWIAAHDRSLRKSHFDLDTAIEIANQINSKDLDIEKIESYAITALRGQFGVLKVYLLRQPDITSDRVSTLNTETDKFFLSFDLNGPFSRELLAIGGPFVIATAPESAHKHPELQTLKDNKFAVCIPLIRGDNELKGILLLGDKFTRQDYSEKDFIFLRMIGNMLAISLHNAQLFMRSISDSLTRVFTRGHFDIQLLQEIDRVDRHSYTSGGGVKRRLSIIMLDVDYFKRINDSYGHQVGDQVLVHLARTLKKGVRSMDVVARYGGEEFIIICPETNKQDAALVGERLRRMVEGSSISTERFGQLRVTASVGVATYPDDAESDRELLRHADRAMYQAKEMGRNRVVLAPDGQIYVSKSADEIL